jgi:hypothetical protein
MMRQASSRTGLLAAPGFARRLQELSPASDVAWFAGMGTGLAFTLLAAFAFPFSEEGKFWAYAGLLIRGALYLWSDRGLKDRGGETLATLFRLGLVAGLFELLVDWGLVHWVANGRLVYLTGNDVVLLASPVWMPVAWACVIVELSYPALRIFGLLRNRLPAAASAAAASLIAATMAGVTVGFYEYFAYRAQWWKYEPAHNMIGGFCALYIPVGEFLMFLFALPIAARTLARGERGLAAEIEGGALFAAAIAAGYAAAYLLLEAGRLP